MGNLYRNFADAVYNFKSGQHLNPLYDFPSIEDGVRGMKFIEMVIASGKENAKWLKL
jgi:hypothetical protein